MLARQIECARDWNTQDEKLFLYEGTVWYHRDFDIGKEVDLNYAIHFGAVNYHATVYLNGKLIPMKVVLRLFNLILQNDVKPGLNSLVVRWIIIT